MARLMTLCLLKRENKLLLGLKKKGFGSGKYNGFGGKVESGEEIETAAIREVKEEAGINVNTMSKVANLSFHFPHKPEWDCNVHVFLSKNWEGDPTETDEMKPEWFSIDKLPYKQQWADDKHWMPQVLEGKFVKGKFVFKENGEVKEHELEIL